MDMKKFYENDGITPYNHKEETVVALCVKTVRQQSIISSILLVITAISMALYVAMISHIELIDSILVHKSFSTVIYSVTVAIMISYLIFKSGVELKKIGLTLDGWLKRSWFSIKVSSVAILIAIACKFMFFSGPVITSSAPAGVHMLLMYLFVVVPAQELIIRVGAQSLFMHSLSPRFKYRVAFSLIFSNILFAATHFGYSIYLVILSGIAGLMIGYIFHKTNSLLAACISHAMVGVAGFYLLGVG